MIVNPSLLVRLLTAACVTLAGCGGPALLKGTQPHESPRHLAEAKDERILASLDAVILRNGPGAWARDAEWDEYLIRIRALSDELVEIRQVAIFDALDDRIESRANLGELANGTREAEWRYKQAEELVKPRGSNPWASVGVITAGGFLAGGNGKAAAGAVLVGVGLAFASAVAASQMHDAEVNTEITRRATTLPLPVPSGSQASIDLFFPVTPRARRTQVVYADRHGEHRLDIDTHQALAELELQVDPPPTIVRRDDPNFPDLARRQGIHAGHAVAILTLDRRGRVQVVDVIESVPLGVFTQEARRTLQRWIYNESRRDDRTVEVKLEFRR